jgi:hypothetical protein
MQIDSTNYVQRMAEAGNNVAIAESTPMHQSMCRTHLPSLTTMPYSISRHSPPCTSISNLTSMQSPGHVLPHLSPKPFPLIGHLDYTVRCHAMFTAQACMRQTRATNGYTNHHFIATGAALRGTITSLRLRTA